MNKIVKYGGIGVAAVVLYVALLSAARIGPALIAPKIKDQDQLNRMVRTEQVRLGLENKTISADYDINRNFLGSAKLGGNTYHVYLGGPWYDVTSLKHEMKHISNGDCDFRYKMHRSKIPSFIRKAILNIKYLFWDEPRAVGYSLTH